MRAPGLILIGAIISQACAPDEVVLPPPSTPLARIGARTLTLGEFAEMVREHYREAEEKKFRPVPPAHYGDLLQRAIELEVLADEAQRRGLSVAAVDRESARQRRRRLASALVQAEVSRPEPPTEAELEEAYRKPPERFRRPERMDVFFMRADRAELARAAREELRELSIGDEPGHRDLLEDYGSEGGMLAALARDDVRLPPVVVRAAFALEENGEVSAPIVDERGYYLVRRLLHAPAATVALSDAAPLLARELSLTRWREATRRYAETLAAQRGVAIDREVLAAFAAAQTFMAGSD